MPPPLCDLDPRRIALIKPSALGDIVHSLPVLTALRSRFPSARITWVVNRAYEPLLRGHPDLDDTLPFDRGVTRGGWLRAARSAADFFLRLRRLDCDLTIDLQGLFRSGLMALATGARRRVGLASTREGARWFYTDAVAGPGRAHLHAVDRYWLVAEAFGAGGQPRQFRLAIDPDAATWADDLLRPCPRPWLVVGAGSRWPTKRWPTRHFATLAARAQSTFGGTVVFVGAADEVPLSAAVRAGLDGPSLDLSGRTTIPQLVALLARADAMLANDTGPLHLAVALGRPVVAPYTCTKVRLTGPYGQARRAVETTVWCAGSYLRKCARLECMAELTPERLWPVLHEVLSAWRSPNRCP
jgi:lipopolysaccharide heptosyltransferase I